MQPQRSALLNATVVSILLLFAPSGHATEGEELPLTAGVNALESDDVRMAVQLSGAFAFCDREDRSEEILKVAYDRFKAAVEAQGHSIHASGFEYWMILQMRVNSHRDGILQSVRVMNPQVKDAHRLAFCEGIALLAERVL